MILKSHIQVAKLQDDILSLENDKENLELKLISYESTIEEVLDLIKVRI